MEKKKYTINYHLDDIYLVAKGHINIINEYGEIVDTMNDKRTYPFITFVEDILKKLTYK